MVVIMLPLSMLEINSLQRHVDADDVPAAASLWVPSTVSTVLARSKASTPAVRRSSSAAPSSAAPTPGGIGMLDSAYLADGAGIRSQEFPSFKLVTVSHPKGTAQMS